GPHARPEGIADHAEVGRQQPHEVEPPGLAGVEGGAIGTEEEGDGFEGKELFHGARARRPRRCAAQAVAWYMNWLRREGAARIAASFLSAVRRYAPAHRTTSPPTLAPCPATRSRSPGAPMRKCRPRGPRMAATPSPRGAAVPSGPR